MNEVGLAVRGVAGGVEVTVRDREGNLGALVCGGTMHDSVTLDREAAIHLARSLMQKVGWTGLLAPLPPDPR